MKVLYLHIGMPKTGTSALQSFFTKNRERLYEDGIWYPEFNAGFMVEEKLKVFAGNAAFLAQHFENLEDMTKEKRLHFEDICRKMHDNDKDILLSSEGLFNKNAIMYKNLMNQGFNVKVIVCLRRQDLWGESEWNQDVKARDVSEDCFHYIQRLDLNYYKRLTEIAAVVGKDNVFVYIYETGTEDIFSTFLGILGIHNMENYQKDMYQANPSLSANFTEIKRIFNSIPKGVLFMDSVKVLLEEGRRYVLTNEKTVHAPSFLKKEERLAIMEKYHESNAMLAKEFLGRDVLFDETIDDSAGYGIDYETIYSDIIKFFGMLFVHQYEEIEKIKRSLYKFPIPGECVGKRIMVYGVDSMASNLYRQLESEGTCKELRAVDRKWWYVKSLYNIPVEDPEMIRYEDIDCVMIAIQNEKTYEAIKSYLIDIKKFEPQKIYRMRLS